MSPKDKHFIRLAPFITLEECHSVITKLGMTPIFWDNIITTGKYDTTTKKKFFAFHRWNNEKEKDSNKPTFQKLSDAFNLAKVTDEHALCKVGNNCSHMYCLTVY